MTMADLESFFTVDNYGPFYVIRYTMERPRFSDHLEAIKFICKDFWSEVFKKQIDNLKTNHRVRFPPKAESA